MWSTSRLSLTMNNDSPIVVIEVSFCVDLVVSDIKSISHCHIRLVDVNTKLGGHGISRILGSTCGAQAD
jgi:hypothetical protein